MTKGTRGDFVRNAERALAYLQAHPGALANEVQAELGFNTSYVWRLLHHLVARGDITRREAVTRERGRLKFVYFPVEHEGARF